MKAITKIFVIFVALALIACTKSGTDPTPSPEPQPSEDYIPKLYLRALYMDNYYYWYKEVKDRNAALDPEDYDIYGFFDAMLYTSDRWSWMCSGDYYRSISSGVRTGTWGLSIGQAADMGDYSLRVAYIFPSSPFEEYGVTRGARLDAIGGKDITEPMTEDKIDIFLEEWEKDTNSFTFTLLDGEQVSFTASRVASLSIRSSLACEVITPQDYTGLDGNVGYFHYLSFTKSLVQDITDAMDYFISNNVKTLILDLRYNGGGDFVAALKLASYLAPKSAQGKVFVKTVHNDILSQYDSDELIPANDNPLLPGKLYILTGSGTASCSEVMINSLLPYMGENLLTVGTQTYGKPNGMYLLPYPVSDADYEKYNSGDFSTLEYAFLPISMYNLNSLGEQIPNDGFIPDCACPDDVCHDFGLGEAMVEACLYHIVNGSFPPAYSSGGATKVSSHPELQLPRTCDGMPEGGLAINGIAPRLAQ